MFIVRTIKIASLEQMHCVQCIYEMPFKKSLLNCYATLAMCGIDMYHDSEFNIQDKVRKNNPLQKFIETTLY